MSGREPSFARTKIQPPRPRAGALVARPGLDARLAAALDSARLVLVSAAAGYGKTTALARQLERPGRACAWVSADAGDDLHRLLECLVAALEPFDLPWRTAPEALIAQVDESRGRARAAAELLNAMDACDVEHGVVVLDDLHRVEDGAVFEFLDLLLERLSPRWTLAIGTRHDPPLALPRLRASGELAEFRQPDLQFDRAEVRVLVAAAGLDEAAADALWERTQGWAAGLRLGLTGGAGQAPRSGERAMFDFIASEVIARLPPGLRRFLLQTSVLPELTAARAAAVSGDAQALQWLEQIDRLGLFVTRLDAAEPTYKLHDLFRAALAQRLKLEQPESEPELWQRAALGEPDPVRRIEMQRAAGDLAGAAETLGAEVPSLLTAGALAGVSHLVDQFPGPFVNSSPVMQQALGLLSWARWDFAAMLRTMQRAEQGFAAAGDTSRAQAAAAYQALAMNALGRNDESAARLQLLRREPLVPATRVVVLVACTWHALDLNATTRIGPLQDELMDLLERTDDASLWYRGHPLPRINGLPGTAAALQRYVQGALRLAGDRPMPLRALAQSQAGWHQAWQVGDLDAAEEALGIAQDDCRWLGNPVNVKGQIQLLGAFVHTLRGQRARALVAAQTLVEDHPAGRGAWSLWANVYYAARIAARFEDREALQGWLARLEQAEGGVSAPATQLALLEPLRGHRAWLAGDRKAAVTHWERALQDEAAIDRLGHAVETRLSLAAALLEGGSADAANRQLQVVAERVDAGAGVGSVLLARTAVERLLGAGPRAGLAAPQAARLRDWLGGSEGLHVEPAAPAAAQPGGLSSREMEVLERIAAGDSNKLIARAFDLSPHTVKRHVANILDKLGADSRGQAAAWFRQQA